MNILGDQSKNYLNVNVQTGASLELSQEEIEKSFKKRLKEPLKKVVKKQGDSLISRILQANSNKEKVMIMGSSFETAAALAAQKNESMIKDTLEKELGDLFSESEDTEDTVELSKKAAKHLVGQLLPNANQRKIGQQKMSGDVFEEEAPQDELGDSIADKNLKKAKKTSRTLAEHVLSGKNRPVLTTKDGVAKVQEYATGLLAQAFNQSPAQKEKMKVIKNELMRRGVTTKQLNHMDQTVGSMVRQQFVYALKKDMLKYFLSTVDPSRTMRHKVQKEYDQTADKIIATKQADSIPIGSLTSMMDKVSFEARQELEQFLYDEASSQFSKTGTGQLTIEEYQQILVKLQRVAAAAGVFINQEELTKKVADAVEDLGLQVFIPPVSGHSFSAQDHDSRDQSQKEINLYVNQEELLEDKLRHLFMMKALNASVSETVELVFKMKKLKNGLIKLGISVDERLPYLKREGEFLAQLKLMSMLEDNFKEQATMHTLEGPAYKLIKKNRAYIIKQLKKCGIRLTQVRLREIRDKMNAQMCPVVFDEYKQLEVMLSYKPHVHVSRQAKLVKSILDRLYEETPSLKQDWDYTKVIDPIHRSVIESA